MFRPLVYLLLVLQAGRIIAEVPASCRKNHDGFSVTEDTYINKIVAFQVASAPSSLNITEHYLTLDNPTGYLNIRNVTVHPSIFYAVGFIPIYQPASQSPKSGAWSCAWHKFIEEHTVYNYTLGGSDTDLELSKLNWDPSPLLFTSYKALKTDFRESWTSVSFGWIVTKNVEGDTRVMGSMARGTFLAYRGDNGKILVGHADMAKLDDGESLGFLELVSG
ncbi:hypothetical protein COCSADRAFT_155193 [Bipolaris sorokiniana ND90Pr]|uniref:Uncharacterized protein n=1 Tax=Cochliobolus sativus (strain ND90Pr / ATCC 201652) TaxID=665912 RepID=M2SP33_COCSN|nr:uncharacterized protein COCSADRAFT_155193 [Bipolaris sorokiniana ND90Pr]EMD68958.1 hypothetical protein COCSADRAFT_155193 [Bipolaris sorokiniana ND90Pr]